MNELMGIILLIPSLLVALTVHEFCHGYVAYKLGDPTPKIAGRLSLNPLRHLDPLGSLMLIIAKFGWAKPVQVNPAYFKNPRKGMMWVGLAGPASNFAMAIISSFILKTVILAGRGSELDFNITSIQGIVAGIFYYLIVINLILGLFNLIPIPPLDGSRVLGAYLPASLLPVYHKMEQYGFLILILLIVVLGMSPMVLIRPVLNFMFRILMI